MTCEQILEKAGLVPTDQYRLRLKRRHGPPEEIKPGQTVHLREHGIERFIAQPKEVQDGLETRREFALSAEDQEFLDSLGLRWEALRRGQPALGRSSMACRCPPGYQVAVADVAIEIAPGYPTSQLDMAYFNPPLSSHRRQSHRLRRGDRAARRQGLAAVVAPPHVGTSVWVPGVDNFERHFAYVQDWLAGRSSDELPRQAKPVRGSLPPAQGPPLSRRREGGGGHCALRTPRRHAASPLACSRSASGPLRNLPPPRP